jgi:hypothetical protein
LTLRNRFFKMGRYPGYPPERHLFRSGSTRLRRPTGLFGSRISYQINVVVGQQKQVPSVSVTYRLQPQPNHYFESLGSVLRYILRWIRTEHQILGRDAVWI